MHMVRCLQPMDQHAAPVLLAYQTPVELYQKPQGSSMRADLVQSVRNTPDSQKTQRQARDLCDMGQVDAHWQQKYSSSALWFQFTPRQLAALYNERHPLAETLHLEQNGMAFSPAVQERTPSTAITVMVKPGWTLALAACSQMASTTGVMPWNWQPGATGNPKRRSRTPCARQHACLYVRRALPWKLLPEQEKSLHPGLPRS